MKTPKYMPSIPVGICPDYAPCFPGTPRLHLPVAALRVPDTVDVHRVDPKGELELPGVALDVGLLLDMSVLVKGMAVLSARVVKGSAEAAVSAGAVTGGIVDGEELLVPSNVLDLSRVEDSELEGGRVAAVVGSVVDSSAEVSRGVGEVETLVGTVPVTSVTVVAAKRWENEMYKGWW